MSKYNLEDFKKIWKEPSKEGILNQFYYEHIELEQLQTRWNSLREWIKQVANEEPMPRTEHFSWVYNEVLDKMNELEGVSNETR